MLRDELDALVRSLTFDGYCIAASSRVAGAQGKLKFDALASIIFTNLTLVWRIVEYGTLGDCQFTVPSAGLDMYAENGERLVY